MAFTGQGLRFQSGRATGASRIGAAMAGRVPLMAGMFLMLGGPIIAGETLSPSSLCMCSHPGSILAIVSLPSWWCLAKESTIPGSGKLVKKRKLTLRYEAELKKAAFLLPESD